MTFKPRKFAIGIFAFMFILGFLFGYFIQGSTVETTEAEIEKVRNDLETFQLEQLLLTQSPERGCPVVVNSAIESSSTLYDIVNQLRVTAPEDPKFEAIKAEADVLSIKSWLLFNAIEDQCGEDTTTVLLVYEENCENCEIQDIILQKLKGENLIVYSVDFNTNEKIIDTLKSSYGISTVPSMIIKGESYGFLTEEEIVDILETK